MKKLMVGLILVILALGTGCITGRPPEFPVANPYAVQDGAGGVIIAYQVNNGQEAHTYVQRLNGQGEALWPKDGVDLGSRTGGFGGEQGDFTSLVADSLGNVTVVYYSDSNIWARKLDMEGNPVWEGETTKKISPTDVPAPAYFKAIGNGAGETIIAWASSDDHINLQKSDSNTNYFISISAPDLDKFNITSDDRGNVFIIWKDNSSYSEGDIFVQKVDAEGRVAWLTGGLQLTNTRNPGYVRGDFNRRIIGDGEGGALAIWVEGVLSEDDGRKIIGRDLYAQRISSEGEMLWGEDVAFIAGMAYDPRIIGDAFENTTVFWGDLQNVYAQRLDATGNVVWPEAGINIGQAGEPSNIMYYCAADDGTGGAVVVWNYSENGNKSLCAQRLDAEGNKLWSDNGIKVSSISPYWGGYSTPARILPDGSGGFFVTWAAGEHLKDKTSSYIQRISGDGEILWGEKGMRLDS